MVTVTDAAGVDHVLPSFPQLSKDVARLTDELTGSVAEARDINSQSLAFANAAHDSAVDAKVSQDSATASAAAADTGASSASAAATTATTQASSASASAAAASASKDAAVTSAASAASSASSAQGSKNDAAASAAEAQSWALTAQSAATGSLHYMGVWDASVGAFPSSPSKGDFWKVSKAGTIAGTVLAVGDHLVYSGTGWDKINNTESVTSVAGRVGAVTLGVGDVGGLDAALAAKSPLANPAFTGGWVAVTTGDAKKNLFINAGDFVSFNYANGYNAGSYQWQFAGVTGMTLTKDSRLGLGGGHSPAGVIDAYTGNGRIVVRTGGSGRNNIDSVTFDNSAYAPLNLSGSEVLINGQTVWHAGNFNPATKSDTTHNHDSAYLRLNPPTAYTDANVVPANSVYIGVLASPSTNTPDGSWQSIVNVCDGNWGFQMSHPWFTEDVYVRSRQSGTFSAWRKLWHTGNFDPSGYVASNTWAGLTGLTIIGGGALYRKSQDGTLDLYQPRIFVQAGDPGAAAGEGDLWIW